jgi:hypothetical protein
MLPIQLINEVKALCEGGLTSILTEGDGVANVLIANYPIESRHYNKSTIELLIRIPLSYPNGKPDMFWTDEDLLLKNGQIPKNSEVIEIWLGKRRRRFSWHLAKWNPGADNLLTYLEFINSRFSRPE